MLQNAYLLAKVGADTAENKKDFAEILPRNGRRVPDHASRRAAPRGARRRGGRARGGRGGPARGVRGHGGTRLAQLAKLANFAFF